MTSADASPAPSTAQKRRRFALVVFVVLAFALAWLVALPLWVGVDAGGLGQGPVLGMIVGAAMMFTPTLAALVSLLLIERVGWRGFVRRTGLGLGASPRRTITITFAVLLGLWGACLVVPFVATLLGGMSLDWSFPFLQQQVAATGQEIPIPMWALALISIFQMPLAAFVPNGILGAAEEIGWRGYMMPELMRLGRVPALLVGGVIWGLWHTPLTLLGHNFQTDAWWGPLVMSVGCIVLGTVLSWARLRTDSVWPAAIGHGMFNAAAGTGFMIAALDPAPNPVIVSPLGVAGWIVLGAIAVALLARAPWSPGESLTRS